ncbi:hypothetical protein [Dactylosporangium sp. NPDC051541]|uniref:hypothetical protein n=1 Tax=Dactylosporangium sp. NPDC051541 TaxID=3363977 RepID=UPI0037ADFC2E
MLDRAEALKIAAAFLERDAQEWTTKHEVRTIPDSAFTDGPFLIVPYNSVALLDHGDRSAQLAGNAPIRVDLATGECDLLDVIEVIGYRKRGFKV